MFSLYEILCVQSLNIWFILYCGYVVVKKLLCKRHRNKNTKMKAREYFTTKIIDCTCPALRAV